MSSSRSSSRLSQFCKLPPISGTNDEPCQSLQDVEETVDAAREEAKTLLKHLSEQTSLVQSRLDERLKTTLRKTTAFVTLQTQLIERSHSRELMQLREQLKEVVAAKDDLAEREKALVDQQTKLSIELAAEVRGKKQAEHKTERQRVEHAEELKRLGIEWEKDRTEQNTAIEKELQIVHQMKDEVRNQAEEVKQLRDQLQKERTDKKRLEHEHSDDENKLSTANKKLVLEVSKLKAQLQSVNNSLNAVHQQNNKMEQKISQMEKDHAVATKTAATHHRATVRSIEEKITQLQDEAVQMQMKYQEQIDDLLRRLHDAQAKVADLSVFDAAAAFEDARIRKLRLQNQEEKRLLEKERQIGPKTTVKLLT